MTTEYDKTWDTTQAFEKGKDMDNIAWMLMGMLTLSIIFYAVIIGGIIWLIL